MTSIKASLSPLCVQRKSEKERGGARTWSRGGSVWFHERRGEGGREMERQNSESSAPLRANDGLVSLTSAADGRPGPSGPLNASSSSAVLFFPPSLPSPPPVLACSPPPQAGPANWLSDGA